MAVNSTERRDIKWFSFKPKFN